MKLFSIEWISKDEPKSFSWEDLFTEIKLRLLADLSVINQLLLINILLFKKIELQMFVWANRVIIS